MTFSQNRFVVVVGGGDGGGGGGVFCRCTRRYRNEHVTLAMGYHGSISCGYVALSEGIWCYFKNIAMTL